MYIYLSLLHKAIYTVYRLQEVFKLIPYTCKYSIMAMVLKVAPATGYLDRDWETYI